jgi:hypothetical protein
MAGKSKPGPPVDPRVMASVYRRDAETRRRRALSMSGKAASDMIQSAALMEEKADRLTK